MDWMTKHYQDRNISILDIGTGHGKMGKILKGRLYNNVDAIDIWEPHVVQAKKSGNYKYVFKGDIRTFYFPKKYDIVILADILEHMTTEDGQQLLETLRNNANQIIIVVPYDYPQHELYGNVYEIHLQPDLNPSNFLERYPVMEMLFSCYNRGSSFAGIGVFISDMIDKKDIIVNHS